MNARRWAVLALLASVQFMGAVDFSIIIVALQSISHQFALRSDELQWVVSAYALMQAGFVLLGGRLFDVLNRKRVFMVALALFGVASLAGGFAPSALFVFVARALQGLAQAVIAPGSLALATDEFEEGRERNRALATFGAVAALGFLLGSVVGGALTGLAGWRSVFFVNVPVILVILVGSGGLLRSKSRASARPRLDALGAIVGTTALLALVAGVSLIQRGPFQAGLPLAFAAVLILIFVGIERTSQDALVPLAVFRSRPFAVAILIAGLVQVGTGMGPFTVSLYLQKLLRISPLETGLIFLPAGAGGVLGGFIVPVLLRRVGLRSTLAAAIIVLGAGVSAIIGPGMHGSVIWIAAGVAAAGFGTVAASVACTIAATSAVGSERMGLAAGLLNTSQFVGSAIGTAAAGVIAAPATLAAYIASLLTANGVLLLALGIALFGSGRPTSQPQPVVRPLAERP